jgi:hypothetical protein
MSSSVAVSSVSVSWSSAGATSPQNAAASGSAVGEASAPDEVASAAPVVSAGSSSPEPLHAVRRTAAAAAATAGRRAVSSECMAAR